MADRRKLRLTRGRRAKLEPHGDHDSCPYVRERCATLVKIADGMSPHAVAQGGLLRPRDPDTVYGWLNTDETAGWPA
jgi:hypothetical protein